MKQLSVPSAVFVIYLLTLMACSGGKQSDGSVQNSGQQEKEYPKTGSVERLDPALDRIISHDTQPEILAEGFEWSEGPLWLKEQQMVIFSDIPENTIYQWSEKDGLKLYLTPSGYTDTIPRGGETGSNGLILDPEGRLVMCQHGDRRIARMMAPLDQPAARFETIVGKWEGKRFNSPNDAVYSSTGDLYFTDPAYGMELGYEDPRREMNFTGAFWYSRTGSIELITDQMGYPNGIGLSPDETVLYVANSGSGKDAYWMSFDRREDGSISGGKVFCDASAAADTLTGACDGFVVRADGMIFAAGPGGVWIIDPDGKPLGIVRTGQATSNCTLDPDHNDLYITADMYLMRIRLTD